MANKKISALNVNTNPTLGDVFPVVNNGETKKLSLGDYGDFIKPYITFTGGTVEGATDFKNGLTADTISATTYNNLPVTPADLGFIVRPRPINRDVLLPEDSDVLYFGPLIMGTGTLTIPLTSTLTILTPNIPVPLNDLAGSVLPNNDLIINTYNPPINDLSGSVVPNNDLIYQQN